MSQASPGGGPRGPSLGALLRWLSAGTLAAFVLVFVAGSLGVRAVLSRIEERGAARSVARARSLLERQGEIREATAREYGWWTPTWDFIDDPRSPASERFFRENLSEWLPAQYGDAFIGIWDRRRRPVRLWADSGAAGLESAVADAARFDLLDSAKSVGGLIVTPRGLFLVGGAVVVRTEDQHGTGPWHGYLVVARPADDSLQRVWSGALQERLALGAVDSAAERPELHHVVRSSGGDSIEIRFPVRGAFGEPVAVVVLVKARTVAGGLEAMVWLILAAATLVGLGLVAAMARVGHRNLAIPLGGINRALAAMRERGRLTALDRPAASREWALFTGVFNETVAALHRTEERYRTLFENAADALFVLEGEEGRIADANPAAERLCGIDRRELLGRPFAESLEPPAEGEGRPSGPARWRRPGERTVPVEVTKAAVDLGERRVVLASVRDLSEREALAERMREAQKLEVLGTLAGGVAHDFNNLLGAILMSAGEIRAAVGPGGPAAVPLETVEKAARRGADLTGQLLSFARRDQVRREPVALNEIAAGVQALCSRTCGHAVSIETRLSPDIGSVIGDPVQLEQAVLNLCLNARDAMPGGGVITLSTGRADLASGDPRLAPAIEPGRYVVFSVADTGTGISPEVRVHLFEPFFTTKERGRGTGLGLATAYGIVRNHGGAIRVESEPGEGSRFEIYLPESEAAPARAVRWEPGSLPRGSETVLIVDDEPDVRRAFGRALRRLGYEIIEAANGREGIERFSERPDGIALVLLDLLMPEMGGLEAFRAIRALRPSAKVLVASGYASATDFDQLLEEGVDGVLAKPFEVAKLAECVRQIIDGARPWPGQA